ncbi:hypothetical protein SADUNF_Sadunf08G0156300 [Salix dunnii]|uniref:Uncharacterized protein n=1 Tax=Salix dunnii TaxID=1413687 RepID=A0A835N1T8_9ROSI|nr:hypothetical protein SADUNF_Sadunf08G0156300 [Salix dunnii]
MCEKRKQHHELGEIARSCPSMVGPLTLIPAGFECTTSRETTRIQDKQPHKIKARGSMKLIPFSAFWLRSSVVSVLISLISDTWGECPSRQLAARGSRASPVFRTTALAWRTLHLEFKVPALNFGLARRPFRDVLLDQDKKIGEMWRKLAIAVSPARSCSSRFGPVSLIPAGFDCTTSREETSIQDKQPYKFKARDNFQVIPFSAFWLRSSVQLAAGVLERRLCFALQHWPGAPSILRVKCLACSCSSRVGPMSYRLVFDCTTSREDTSKQDRKPYKIKATDILQLIPFSAFWLRSSVGELPSQQLAAGVLERRLCFALQHWPGAPSIKNLKF